jgi:hypothetical protein
MCYDFYLFNEILCILFLCWQTQFLLGKNSKRFAVQSVEKHMNKVDHCLRYLLTLK